MNTFTWGIIGPGSIATEFAHDLPLVKGVRHRVGAVLSHSLEKAAVFAKEEDAPQYFEHLEDFVTKGRMDAVYIATPHPLHYEETLACLQHRIPVLCEKPLAMNSRQVQQMVDAAVANNTFLLEGMWIRFLPSIQKVLSLVNNGMLGRILSVKADMSFKAPREPGSRYFDPEKGGGSLLDLGIYPAFLSLLLLGKPSQIKAIARLSDKKIDESCAALLSYADGRYAMIESSLAVLTEHTAIIYGEHGKIMIEKPWNEMPAGIITEVYGGSIERHSCTWEGRGFQFEAEEVYNCVQQGRLYSDLYCHQFSLDLMDILDSIRRQTGIVYPADQHA